MSRTRRLFDLARGLLALLVLLAALAGIPAAVHAFWHPAWPAATVPAWTHALTSPDNGSALYLLLGIVGWAAWGGFALAVILELPAQLRRRPTVRVPGLHWAQAGAAVLVTAILVAAAPAIPLSAHLSPALPTPTATAATTALATVPTAASTRAYTVQPGDSAHALAEAELGDPAAYRTIAALNDGHVMNDGAVFSADQPLHPGWVIALPANPPATTLTAQYTVDDTAAPPAATGPATSVIHTVVPGDNLWNLSAQYLGSGADYPQIFAENTGRPLDAAGDELTDANLIEPGENLTIDLPATPGTGATAPAAAPGMGAGTGTGAPSNPAPAPADPTTSGPPASASAPSTKPAQASTPATQDPVTGASTPSPGAGSAPPGPSPAAAHRASGHHDTPAARGSGRRDVGLDLAAALGVLTLAVLVGALARRRRLQEHHRRIGERSARPEAPGAVRFERAARADQSAETLTGIDRALREMAHALRMSGARLPALRGALHHRDATLELHLDEPADLPAPWQALDEEHQRWSRATEPGAAIAEPAPYPALVDLGVTEDGASVLIDLEHATALTLTGPNDECEALLARLVLHLADSPWADHLTVHLAEFGRDLADALGSDRVQFHATFDDALDELSDWASAVSDELTAREYPHVRHARTDPDAAGLWPPHILFAVRPLSDPEAGRLTYVLTTTPAPSIAAAVAHPHQHAAGSRALHVTFQEPTTVPGLDVRAYLHHITAAQRTAALDLLATSANLVSLPNPAWEAVLSGAAAHQPPAPHTLLPALLDLGEPAGDAAATAQPDDPPPAAFEHGDPLGQHAEPAAAPAAEPVADQDLGWPEAGGPISFPPATAFQSPATAVPLGWGWSGAPAGAPALARETPENAAAQLAGPPALPAAPAPAGAEEPRVHLLGPVRITGARGPIEPNRVERCLELAAYLCLYPARGFSQIVTDIWPDAGHQRRKGARDNDGDDDPQENDRSAGRQHAAQAEDARRARRVRSHHGWTSRLRKWLGKDPLGAFYLPLGHYYFSERVSCDWVDFLDLAAHGRLDEALELVRGTPFDGVCDDRYGWAENARLEMIEKIVDVAYTSGTEHLDAGRHAQARAAVMTGLSLAPEREDLGRVLIYALLRSGRRTEAAAVGRRILTLCEELDIDAQAETLEAIRAVHGPRRAARSAGPEER